MAQGITADVFVKTALTTADEHQFDNHHLREEVQRLDPRPVYKPVTQHIPRYTV
jgi:hypothetical protein